MANLNDRMNEVFPGLVVRKDLVKLVKGNAVVPGYVLEYLLGQYCASDDSDTVKAGIENVKEILRLHYVNRNEAELVKSRIKERGHHKVIDRVGVELNEKSGVYEMAFSNLGIKKVPIDVKTVKDNRKLLVGGVWCLVDVQYELMEEKGVSPWSVRSLKPIQMASFDMPEYLEGRSKMTTDEWIDALMQSLGLDPARFGRRNKFFQLMRLIPFCERNYNLIELGPKGTGKSHVYSECSPHGMLLSGGEVTLAKLFVNNSTGKIGLVGYWDCVAFDEFAGKEKKPDKALVDVMKNYMANKTFSRGIEPLGAEASIAFVGNTMHSVPQMLKNSNLFEQLPSAYLDSAFIDRIHNYIPGWEVDIIRGEMFTTGYGFIIDYLSEAMHSLRELDFTGKYKEYFALSSTISTRDRDGVQKTFSGLMKVLHPSGEATKDEVKELLKLSMEARKRVKDQLFRIDPTYDPVDFSFTDNETGEKISVKTLEEVEYPSLYYRNGEQPESTENVENGGKKCEQPSQGDVAVDVETDKSRGIDEEIKTALSQLGPKHVSVHANQRGVTYCSLFGDYLKGASKVVIVDPFIYKAYQMDNLIDLIHLIYDLNQDSEETLSIELHTTIAPEKSQEQDQALLDIKDELAVEGIEFDFCYDANHDRMIVVDDKWVINLGRGLDIYEYCSRFSLKHASQRLRKCREFNVSIVQK